MGAKKVEKAPKRVVKLTVEAEISTGMFFRMESATAEFKIDGEPATAEISASVGGACYLCTLTRAGGEEFRTYVLKASDVLNAVLRAEGIDDSRVSQ